MTNSHDREAQFADLCRALADAPDRQIASPGLEYAAMQAMNDGRGDPTDPVLGSLARRGWADPGRATLTATGTRVFLRTTRDLWRRRAVAADLATRGPCCLAMLHGAPRSHWRDAEDDATALFGDTDECVAVSAKIAVTPAERGAVSTYQAIVFVVASVLAIPTGATLATPSDVALHGVRVPEHVNLCPFPGVVRCFDSTSGAYDACDQRDVAKGEVLMIVSECVIGVADTWPLAVTAYSGALHRPLPSFDRKGWALRCATGETGEGAMLIGLHAAIQLASLCGWPLATPFHND